jgi:hypothetical protein
MGDYNKWDYQSDYHRQDCLERHIDNESESYDDFDWGTFISLEFDYLCELLEEYEKWDPLFRGVSIVDLTKDNHLNVDKNHIFRTGASSKEKIKTIDELNIKSFAHVVSSRYTNIFKEFSKYIFTEYKTIEAFHASEEYNMYYKDFYNDYINLTNYDSIVYNFNDRVSETHHE